jgi:hypothetical protein
MKRLPARRLQTRKLGLAFALSLVAGCVTLALGAAAASAAIAHPFLSSFNGEATPGGSFELAALAIDYSASQSAGDVYVATGSTAVDKFSAAPDSSFLCQITGAGSATSSLSECDELSSGAPGGAFNGTAGVAVDPATGDVYISDAGHHVIDKFDASGAYVSQITGLSRPGSLAVDASTGDLYILDEDEVKKYDPTSASLTTFATGTPAGSFERAVSLAVDNSAGASAGDVYVDELANNVVAKFDSSGAFLSQLSGPASGSFSQVSGVAVDPVSGDLYVADDGAGTVEQFDAAGSWIGQIARGSMVPEAVALAANGDVYVADVNESEVDVFGPGVVVPGVDTGVAGNVAATSATLEGTVNPAALTVSDCHFDYVDEAHYSPSLSNPYGAGLTAPCVPDAAALPADSEDHSVSAAIAGLTPGTTYHFRLEASNANGTGEGKDATLTTLPTPVIDSAIVSELTASSALLTAKINPRGSDTVYHFEYGTSTSYGESVPAPAEDIGSGEGDVARSQTVRGLTPNRIYHWRVVATNANGTTIGVDHTFIYEGAGGSLPDGRAYEMVTPAHKNGALFGVRSTMVPVVSSDGTTVMAPTLQCFGSVEGCNGKRRNTVGEPYQFSRTSSGWTATALSPPATTLADATPWGYSPDAGMALFGAPTEPFGQEDLYVRTSSGKIVHFGPITLPEFGPQTPEGGSPASAEQATSADFSHIAWETSPTEAERKTLWPYDETLAGHSSAYEYAAAGETHPLLVGVTGSPGSESLVSKCGTHLGAASHAPGAMSSSGRVVFFTANGGPGCTGSGTNANVKVEGDEILARVDGELSGAHTVEVSARASGNCTGECLSSPVGDAGFAAASVDGSKVVFMSTQQLTDQASEDHSQDDARGAGCTKTTHENGCNLYLYDFANPMGQELMDVSAGAGAGGPRVQGVMAVSDDGSHVYFVARGVLSANTNEVGQSARNGVDNLYVFDRAGTAAGQVKFIAALPGSGGEQGEWDGISISSANVTPDGRYLVFLSSGNLTQDDSSVSGALQVFRYDAQTGRLLRMSIGNNGFNDNGNRSAPTPCTPSGCIEDATLAVGEERRDLSMSDDGSYVFFDSPVGLTATALDDVQVGVDTEGKLPVYAQNVYEWHDGHVYLISDGRDVTLSAMPSRCPDSTIATYLSQSVVCLLGADRSGSNVFFSTGDQLTPEDVDTEMDYYDARICAPSDPCVRNAPPRVSCEGDSCQASAVPAPPLLSAASVVFSGPGNTTAGSAPSAVVKVTVLSKKSRGGRFVLSVDVPEPGRISISGAGVGSLRRVATRTGVYRFAVRLTAAERATLRRRHRHRLAVLLHVSYRLARGGSSTASVRVLARV